MLGALPDGISAEPSDFSYEWEDVVHNSRVWERGPADAGSYHVDLTIKVMRGSVLRDLESVRDYLVDYDERDPDEWDLEPFDRRGRLGYRSDSEAFWLQAPGVAVAVKIDTERFSERDFMQTVRGIRPAID